MGNDKGRVQILIHIFGERVICINFEIETGCRNKITAMGVTREWIGIGLGGAYFREGK